MDNQDLKISHILASHDILTPLHALQGGFEIFASGALGPLNSDARAMLAEMSGASNQLQKMLEQLAIIAEAQDTECFAERRKQNVLTHATDHGWSFADAEGSQSSARDHTASWQLEVCEKQLRRAFEMISRELLSDQNGGSITAKIDANRLTAQSDNGPDPQSGNHQLTAMAVRTLLAANGLRFAWQKAGVIEIENAHS